MGDKDQDTKGGAAGWFFKKLFTSPATYLGIAVSLAAGNAALGVDMPLGGAIGGGLLMGFAAGMISFAIMHGIRTSHNKALESGKDEEPDSNEQTILETLRRSGQSDDADLLKKMFGDRDAISNRCRGDRTGSEDARHTLELASAIVKESCHQAEELQDLVRRVEDPLLTSPDGADKVIAGIRGDLQQAYQAVADARSRLRRGEPLKEIDFLADSESLGNLNLSSLTAQLKEETSISKRVEERLRPEFKNRIVMEDPLEPDADDLRESE